MSHPPARRPPGKPPAQRPLSRLEKGLLLVIGGLGGFLVAGVVLSSVVAWPGWVSRFGAIPAVVAAAVFLWLRQRGDQ